MAYANRGLIYYDLGLFEQSMIDCDKAIAINPEFAPSYYYRGLIYGQEESNEELALEEFKQTVDLDPFYQDAYYAIAILYYNREDLPNAKETLDKLINMNDKHAEAYYLRSKVNSELYGYAEGIEDAIKAFEIDPENFPLDNE